VIQVYGPIFVGGRELNRGVAFFMADVGLHKAVARIAVVYEPESLSIGTVFVEEDFRRKGLSKKLHEIVYKWAQVRKSLLFSGLVVSDENKMYWESLVKAGLAERLPDNPREYVRI